MRWSLQSSYGNEIIFGIELDPIGRKVAYHFHRTHPGDVRQRGVGETVRVPAEQVLPFAPVWLGPTSRVRVASTVSPSFFLRAPSAARPW
jgi:capsid protein